MSKALTDAAASWYGMNPDQLASANMTVGASQRLRFTFTVEATDEDYLGICDRMVQMREPSRHETSGFYLHADGTYRNDDGTPLTAADGQEDQPAFVAMPTMQEVMRNPVEYIDRAECAELLNRAMMLSKDVERRVCDARSKQIGMPVYFNRIQAKMQEKAEQPGTVTLNIKGHP